MLESAWYELTSRSAGWFGVVAVGALKAAGILAVTALVAYALRRASAAVRHQVWLVGVVCALAVPLLGVVLPRITVPGPAWLATGSAGRDWPMEAVPVDVAVMPAWSTSALEASLAEMSVRADALAAEAGARVEELAARLDEAALRVDEVAARAEAAAGAAAIARAEAVGQLRASVAQAALHSPHIVVPEVTVLAPPPGTPAPVAPFVAFPPPAFGPGGWAGEGGGFPWGMVALFVWLLGVWVVTAGIVLGALRVAWIGWQAKPVTGGRVATLAAAITDELGLRDVRVLLGSSTAMPMTWGLFRTTVLLPEGAESWPVDQLDAALRHELAHARRRDTLTQLIADVACALYWFNPLTWLAAHRLRVEREHACDDEVLSSGSKPSDYATQLLDMTRALRAARVTAMAAIPMARPSQLRDRLEAVLDDDRERGRLSRPAHVRGWAAGFVIALPFAMLGFSPVPSFADDHDYDYDYDYDFDYDFDYDATDHADVAVAVDAALPHAFAWQACGRARDNSYSVQVNDDEQRIEWYADGCRRTVEIDGRIIFDDAFRRIAALSPGTRVRIEVEVHDGRERAIDIRPIADEVVYRYFEDGSERAFGEEQWSWLDGIVLELLRTGYAAEERVAALLRQGGADAVLAEVDHLRGDYARRIYFQAALAADVTPAQAAALIARAGAGIRSDFELAELLIATADDRPFTADIADAFLAAAQSVSSDYERRRVLAEVLARAELSAEQVVGVIASAAELRSDFEKTELLVGLANDDIPSIDAERAYIDAAASVRSDHDRRRALDALLVQGRLAPELVVRAIRAAAELRSDHDKAETLLHIARTQTLDDESRAEMLDAVETLRSDYDHGRVSSALLRSRR